MTEKYIPIAESALRNMLESVHLHSALVQGGVDNWEWADTSITQYLNELGAESIDEFVQMDIDSFEREAEALKLPVNTYDGKVEKIKLHYWGVNEEVPDKIVEIRVPSNKSRGDVIEEAKMKWWEETIQYKCLNAARALEEFRTETFECLGVPHDDKHGWARLIDPKIEAVLEKFVSEIIGYEVV